MAWRSTATATWTFYGGKGSGRTKDSDSLKGTTGHVTERVTRYGGQVKLDAGGFNPYFAARSIDGEIPEGTEVMVIDPGGGNVVTVEPIDFIEDAIDRELARERSNTERTNAEPNRGIVALLFPVLPVHVKRYGIK